MNQKDRELVDLASKMIDFFTIEKFNQAQKAKAAAEAKAEIDKAKAAAAKAREAKKQREAKLQKKYEAEAAKQKAGCTIGRLLKRVDAANAQVNLQAEAMGLLRSERDALLSLIQELVSEEGPQPGTEDWARRARKVIAKATKEKKAA